MRRTSKPTSVIHGHLLRRVEDEISQFTLKLSIINDASQTRMLKAFGALLYTQHTGCPKKVEPSLLGNYSYTTSIQSKHEISIF